MSIRTWLARYVRRPFQGAGRATTLLAAGVAVLLGGVLTVGLLWALLAASPLWSWGLAWVVAVVVAVAAAPLLSWTQRRRFRLFGVGIAVPEGLAERPGLRGVLPWLWSAAGRRQLRYHFLAGPLVVLGGALTLFCWVAGAAAATVYLWIWVTPTHWRIDNPGYTTRAAYVTVAGVAVLYGTGWFAKALARVDTAAARTLLGPSREEQLARRVTDLADSRASVIDAADAERRRIERDLHDGAQQRLVALAVNLGLAKATLGDLSDEARAVIDDAHREAKEAITELGNLVRGLHPAVLEDRGLDAALSGIAARLPIPVRVAVDLPRRPLPTIEAVAYFVVSEALTNVVKHAQATRAEVTVEQIGGTLLVVVTDDGVGGAELSTALGAEARAEAGARTGARTGTASRGTGLAGLAKRVASVDGMLTCHSPLGGPTVITVELPCAP